MRTLTLNSSPSRATASASLAPAFMASATTSAAKDSKSSFSVGASALLQQYQTPKIWTQCPWVNSNKSGTPSAKARVDFAALRHD
jgi:hypothetical protein